MATVIENDELVVAIHELVSQAAADAAATRKDITAILDKFNELAEQVTPTLDAIMKNPMLKMLLK